MPRNGTGGYTQPSPDVQSGTTIASAVVNGKWDDLGQEIANSIAADGQTTPTANLPMGGFKHTNVADGTSATDYAAYGQLTTLSAATAREPFLTNGGFDIWQASTSLAIAASATTTATIYAADQWCMETSANQACVVSRQTGTNTARYRVRVQRNSGQTGTSVLRFQQPLEIWDVIRLRGRVVTVSCTAKAGANFAGALRMKLLTGTGTEGRRTNAASYTSEATPLDTAMAITTSDATFSGTGTAVSASATQAALVFEWTPVGTAGAADLFELQDVWLDFGATATAFPYEPPQQTAARCNRFFWKTLAQVDYVGNAAASTQNQLIVLKYPATMRATPTVSAAFSGGVNVTSVGVANTNADMAQPYAVSVASGTTAYTYDAGNTADARL